MTIEDHYLKVRPIQFNFMSITFKITALIKSVNPANYATKNIIHPDYLQNEKSALHKLCTLKQKQILKRK